MKVINKYDPRKKYDLSTNDLITLSSDREGQIEQLEDKIIQLTRIIANIIDHSKFTDAEILKIIECECEFELNNE